MCMPDLNLIIAGWWGDYDASWSGIAPLFATATNCAFGTNPAYGFTQLAAIFPKFLGPATPIAMTLTTGNAIVVLAVPNAALAIGQLIIGPGIPLNTTISSVNGVNVTLTAAATISGAASVNAYLAPLVPITVLMIFFMLATSQLGMAKWGNQWVYAMALYVAHFATLWLQSEGQPQSNAGQAANNGLTRGIAVSKSVGGESISYQPTTSEFEGWGNWQATTYGVQLITQAAIVGWGIMVIA